MKAELEQRNEERLHAAAGTSFAIAQALGGKKALKDYQNLLARSISDSTVGDSSMMSQLRKQIKGIVGAGNTKAAKAKPTKRGATP